MGHLLLDCLKVDFVLAEVHEALLLVLIALPEVGDLRQITIIAFLIEPLYAL